MKIRFIVETVTSMTDACGNRYHFATITSTLTGKSVRFEADGSNNAASIAYRITKDWGALYCIGYEVPKTEWKRMAKSITLYEHMLTTPSAEVAALEQTP